MRLFKARVASGVSLLRRRFTAWAALYFAAFVAAPILGVALAIDVILFFVFTRLLDRCYGVLCFFT